MSTLDEAIAAANRNFMDTFARGDAQGMAALYTADGALLPTNSGTVQGQDAIAEFWGGAMGMGIETATLETVELEGDGSTAIEVGRYALGGGGETVDEGKYIVIWKNEDGAWKLHRDIWNTSRSA